MPSTLQAYAQMADHAATQITGSHVAWTDFLTTAARLYKYPYNEQLMIYAQRPDATACAEYDFWNEKMQRYVRRGSKGIAIIDATGDKPRLRYVFDVADTGGRDNSRSVNLWEYQPEHSNAVTAMLERNYDVSGSDGLADQLERVAAQLADEYWNDHQRDIFDIVDDSFLEEYDDFNIGVAFRNAATVSITYSLMSRCGLEPQDYFEHEDFLSIFDFNTPATVAALGTAVSEVNQQVLRQIEVTIKNYERERSNEHDRIGIQQERGLPESRPDDQPAGDGVGQIREDAEELSEGAPPDSVEQPAFEREAVPAPVGDRADGAEPLGADDAGAGESGGRDREPESVRPDEVDGADEHLQGAGGGNDSRGADLQLNPFGASTTGAVQMSLFPSENEQMAFIEQAESVGYTPFAFSFPQEDIDHVLRLGGNNDNSRHRVAAQYMMQKPTVEIAAFLSEEYVGGGGFKTDAGELSAWYAEDGIHLARGRSARYVSSAQVIPWEDAATRIGELLEQGQFATNVELAEMKGYTRSQLAQSLWYLRHDFDESAREQGYLSSMDDFRGGGFPDETERLSVALSSPEQLATITQEYTQFLDAYRENRDLLRFHYHRPAELLTGLHELALPWREYATAMTEPPQVGRFITEDEITAALTYGSSVEGGKGRIYSYFSEKHPPKEQVTFLKNEYGIGGHNGALPGSFHSYENHDGKGIELKKPDCANVQMPWSIVAKRITELIRKDRYFTPQEHAKYEELQRIKAETDPMPKIEYTRIVNLVERVPMCGIPANRLEQDVEQLRDKYDVTISGIEENSKERRVYSLPSIDHEAERATDAHEAEFGADGWRAFPGNTPEQPTVQAPFEQYKPVVIAAVSEDVAYRNACGHSDRENAEIECNAAVRRAILNSGDMELIRLFSDMPEFRSRLHQEIFDEIYPLLHELLRPLSQDDIDAALQRWNGNVASKRRVQDYMIDHAREKDTAEWLSREYGGDEIIVRAGSPEAMELPWSKVQRYLAQLVREDRFFTGQELDNFNNIDTAAIKENLATNGIVNGQVVEESVQEARYQVVVYHHIENGFDEKLDYQTLQEAEKVAQGYVNGTLEADGFAYDGAAIYDLQEKQYLRVFGDYPDDAAIPTTQPVQEAIPIEIAAELDLTDTDLQDVLTGDGGLLDYLEKDKIGGWFRDGDDNAAIAQKLGDSYAGTAETMTLLSGETADYFASTNGIAINIHDKFNTNLSFGWNEIAPVLRAMYEQERDGFSHEPTTQPPEQPAFPYAVGDTVYLEDGKAFIITELTDTSVQLQDPTLFYPIFRAESRESFARLMERYPQPEHEQKQLVAQIQQELDGRGFAVSRDLVEEGLEDYSSRGHGDFQDIADYIENEYLTEEQTTEQIIPAENFRITDDALGVGGAKAKFRMNMDAINLLKELELDGRQATPEEQEVLSKYVGWGGLADAFDESKQNWSSEFQELYATLSPEEYAAARSSTLNAHYTSPAVIHAIYDAVGNMGFQTGNILEPSMGVGNFFGCLPEEMRGSKLYGVELDSLTGRIAKQLYPQADITVAGFETTDRRDFYDLAIGNVPFGQYQVSDRAYNKLGFSIHNYFFAKALDQVRAGGVVAFVTSRYTMDAKDNSARKYLAQRADFLGAIRLPNNAFRANAGTDVVSDIIFLQKRDRPIAIEPDWVHLGENEDGFAINSYFTDHPEMILGRQTSESTQYGRQDFTVAPIEGLNLADQLSDAIKNIRGTYAEAELPELGEGEEIDTSIPADPNVKNYSYTVVDGAVYYRENSRMVRPELNATAAERVKGMVELRDCVQKLIGQQMDGFISDTAIRRTQAELNDLYDSFSAKYGLINSRGNALAFSDDSSYYLLCSLEVLDEDNNLERKADMFTKRTIKSHEAVTSVDTAAEALALSISEKAKVDMAYMSQLTGKDESALFHELKGVIFLNPMHGYADSREEKYVTADEYLSGNVRQKLEWAERSAEQYPDDYTVNVTALTAAQPKDLDASEIDVRLGATWLGKEYIQAFMEDLLDPPYYQRRNIQVNFADFTGEWNITGKSVVGYGNVAATMTYGTERASAYRILEDTLNLRDVRIYDTQYDPDGKERRVLNSKETTLAQQKQQAIKDAFRDWLWKDPDRRHDVVQKYNELFNSTRPREYDGRHITFSGINPEIHLREHQLNAVAHVLYGGNTLLAHEVGAGKTFEMVAAAMESKRLGLCQKSLFAVPNHLTEQWASEFLRLYPSANILVATKKDFETRNRKKFCARIATGDYDAVIVGHSQFERIPVSRERQEQLLQEQIWEIEDGLEELKSSHAERFTIKQLERTKKSLEARLEKLNTSDRKDDVVTFEQLGVDRLYVDEAHSFKNLFLYTKMRNVAGLSTTDAQKSSDMLLKCRYIDEITDSRGVVFATGTPVSNSMTELFTMQRYLQHDTIQRQGLAHFDSWASTFGETQTAIELAPEGTGYRARTRFAKFFNLPELMTLFKEVADIKTADQLNLPTPTPVYHNEVSKPTELQQEMVKELSERAAEVHSGRVEPNIDNMLKITSDGRKLGLDQRVINPDLPDDPRSKVNKCVDNITQIWRDGQPEKLTQLVFCDLSTPKSAPTKKVAKGAAGNLDSPELHALEQLTEDAAPERAFSIYDDIREKLVAKGIPREQIAFIHEANTEVRKKELFAKVRSGQVRVLMGSTFKMGAGMNVQDRLVALHDLDCPWRPGDLEQRSGRIIRQGNRNKEVHIFRYVTEGTFDSYLWQTVENKQKFISQIMTSKSPVRSCEDIDETALSYAEVKALCAGDDRIREKMNLDTDVSRLRLMKANHQSQQYRLEDSLLRTFPEQIEQNKGFIAGFDADMATLAAHPHPQDGFAVMEVKGDKLTDKDNAGAAILEAFKDAKGLEPVPIGSYRGFAMSLTVEDFGRDFILTLKGQMTHRVSLGKDAKGNLIRIDNALNGMAERRHNVEDKLTNLHAQMAAAKAEIGKPFPQENDLKEKSALLADLNDELNIDERTPMERMAEPEIAKSARPSVLEKLKASSVPGRQDKTHKKEMEAR